MIKLGQFENRSIFYAESSTCNDVKLEISQNFENGLIAPIVILVIEVVLAVSFNVAAISLYYRKPGRLKNAGDKFTVSLMVVDLLFCGLGIPLTLAVELYRARFGSWLDEACMAFQSLILFSATASTIGTALIALDRADISIRPSRRFFNESRQTRTLCMAWMVSLTMLFVPFVANTTKTNASQPLFNNNNNSNFKNTSDINVKLNVQENCTLKCDEASCQDNQCSLTGTELAIRVALQSTVFLMTSITTLTVYLRILRTVQRRNYRYDKNLMQGVKTTQDDCRKSDMFQKVFCCGSNLTEQVQHNPNRPNFARTTEEKTLITTTNNHTDENTSKNGNNGVVMVVKNVDNNDNQSQGTKTDFASVALSITVVLALKRMVAAKIARKRKKVRHLRRMTILILFSFLLGWTPFHILPVVKIFVQKNLPDSTICFLSECVLRFLNCDTTTEVSKVAVSNGSEATWEILFLWSLVFAALSSIINPFVYSFSREKLREEMKKKFLCCGGHQKYNFNNRGRSAIWTSPWGKTKGGNSPKKPKESNSPKNTKQSSISNITV